MLNDQIIIDRIVEGHSEDFGELIARYQQPVFRLAMSMLGNSADAEDASQEVFLRAYKSLPTYIDSGRFWGWLRRITINVCLKATRPVVMMPVEDIDEIAQVDGDSVCESVMNSARSNELREMISQLPPLYRCVLVLKYLEDMSYAEIAQETGESVSNIQVRIFRAKKILRERFKVCTI